ncbi:uncharacterized protein LOC127861894 [Dreissena polymorpha]|uniref:uncharacterized protein LOC127861894 n=1 Tax=Dreissena polymorpha TaxID=45954 RepID=UPI0022641D08|nr:uncharacterized protein LOC127861894 [Dreissena polymorpha]
MISTNESMFDSSSSISASTADTRSRNFQTGKDHCFSQTKPFDNNVSMGKRRSAFDSKVPYVSKKEVDSAGNKKKEKRRRDLIIQDEDEEDQYPYVKVTFNKKSDKALKRKEDKDSMSSSSRSLQSQDSIYSVGLMNQYMALNHRHKSLKTKDSSSSLTSMTSSLNDMSFAESSAFDSTRSGSVESADVRQKFNPFPYMNRKPGPFPFMATNSACTHRYPLEPQTAFQNYGMYNYQSTIAAMGHKPNPETVFADLSFSEASAILPERFMKSWFEKVYINQQEEYFRTMVHPQMPLPNMPSTFYSSYYEDDIDLPPSVSAHQSGYNTPAMTRSLENIHAQVDAQKGYQKLQNRTIRRSNSLMTKISSRNSFDYSNLEHNEVDEEILSKVGPLPLQKENSFDKLRRILQTKEMPIYKDRSERRSVFAANHQKSLPIFLETLNEEDEERRRSRTPSVEKRYSETSLKKQNNSQVIQREMIISTAGSDSFSSDSRKSSVFNTIHGNLLQCSVEHEGNNEFNTVYSDDGEKDMQELGIPSIVVSQKYSDDELKSANEILCITPMRSLSNERKGSISRPSSPITVNELGEENQSKYSLEIDEIFSPKEKNSKLAYVINVQKIDSVSPTNETDDLFMERVDVKSHLSARARDEKLLSPTSSVYSPNMMSPITVIEAVHLDNTKDCDANGKKESESLEKTSDISSEGREKSVPAGENNSFSFNPFAKKLLKTNKHSNAPKCLQLKRHLTNSREGQPTNVTFGNIAQPVVKQEIKHDSRTNQSQLEDLPPIITFPNIADLLEEILHHMPPVQSNSPVPMTSENCPDCRHYEDNIENLQVKRNVSHLIKDHVMSHNDMTHEGKQTLDQICQTDTTRFELLRHRAVNLLDLILQDIQYGQLESCLCFNKNYSTVRQMSHSCIQTEKKFRSEVNLYVTQPVYRSEFQMDINTSDVRKQNLNVKINEKPSCDGWEKAFDQQYKENSETTEATQHDDGDYKVFLDAQSENECEEPHMDYGANNSEVRMQYIRIKSLSVSRIDFENAESEDVHKLIECEENFYKDNDILQSQLSFIGCQQIQADSKNMYSNTYPLETVQDSAHRETGNEMSTFECDEYLPVQTPRAWVEKGSKNEGLNKSLPTYGSDSKDEIKRTETAKFKNMFGFEEKQSNLFYVETEHNSNVNGIGYQTPTTVLDNEKVITRKRTFQRSKNTEEEGSEMNIGSVQDLNIENILVQDGEQEYVESASLKTKIAQVVSVKPEHKLAINIVDALNHCEQNNNTESISLMRTPAEHVSKAPKPVSQSELGYRFSEENDCYHMFTKLKVSIDTDTVDYGNEPLVQTNYSSMDIDKSSVKENANNESDNLEMSTPCVHSFDKYKHLCRNEDKSPSFNVSSNEQTGQSSHKSITPKLHSNTNEKSVWIVSKSFDGFQYGTGESQAEKEKIFVLSGTKHEYEVDKRQLKSRPYEYWDSLNEHRLVKSVDDFDMFQQIDEESEYEKEPETDLLSDAETKKTFEEIERLYKMSGHCGTNRYGNVTDMEDDVLECNPVPGNSHERFLMDENYDILDHETAQMEAYLNGSTCM